MIPGRPDVPGLPRVCLLEGRRGPVQGCMARRSRLRSRSAFPAGSRVRPAPLASPVRAFGFPVRLRPLDTDGCAAHRFLGPDAQRVRRGVRGIVRSRLRACRAGGADGSPGIRSRRGTGRHLACGVPGRRRTDAPAVIDRCPGIRDFAACSGTQAFPASPVGIVHRARGRRPGRVGALPGLPAAAVRRPRRCGMCAVTRHPRGASSAFGVSPRDRTSVRLVSTHGGTAIHSRGR